MADEHFDAVQFGRLIQSVETLTQEVSGMRSDVNSLKDTRSKGWGILTGVAMVGGGLGSFGHSMFEKLIK